MTHIVAPTGKRLVWYLALEEYIASHIEAYPDGVFFTWIVSPTVIFGRHQILQQEVNTDFCKANAIPYYRRKSGGGCVYADEGNLMLSYISPSTHSEAVFNKFIGSIAHLLSDIGIEAVCTEHNDILVGNKKISGNACFAAKESTIVHGTMLYNVDFSQLQQAITPSNAKLEKHGVQSVRQRVANLCTLTDKLTSINELSQHLTSSLCTDSVELSPEDLSIIDSIELTYLNPEFIEGHL